MHILHNMLYYLKGDDSLNELYVKSLQMIKELDIRNMEDYNKYVDKYLILNVKSLKFMANKKCFKDIVKIARKVS